MVDVERGLSLVGVFYVDEKFLFMFVVKCCWYVGLGDMIIFWEIGWMWLDEYLFV